ncbi:MAG TPA: hypothetical protein VNF72_02335, partial [Myxococcota bacterium]|nr:hypothetical protein [Myxococcota bacterium]
RAVLHGGRENYISVPAPPNRSSMPGSASLQVADSRASKEKTPQWIEFPPVDPATAASNRSGSCP